MSIQRLGCGHNSWKDDGNWSGGHPFTNIRVETGVGSGDLAKK